MWGLLIDGRSWPRWSSGLDELVAERSSGLDPHGQDGVGAIRAFRTGRVVTGERLTELVDGRRLAYEDAFNFAMKEGLPGRHRVDAGPGRRHDNHLARNLADALRDRLDHALRPAPGDATDGRRPRELRGRRRYRPVTVHPPSR
ncbi:MAG TPA: hypothetical protein VGJ45_35290 [Pseudonocardiaceae bacterium]